MPIISWIGKESVVNHDKDVPFRLLTKIKEKSIDGSDNLIIEGDNLESLKSLLPFYQGRIKCIYIDPPYNTGAEHWIYNDNVNSPKIKQWLGKVVGSENEDLTRHDKWLCMMYPRLKLLKDLLRDDGIIFVSIDDNEFSNLQLIMNDIFEENYLGTLYVQVRYPDKTLVEDMDIQKLIEMVLVYGKSPKATINRRIEKYSVEKFVWKIDELEDPTTVQIADKTVKIFKKGQYKIIEDKPSKYNLKEIWASGKILDGNSSGRFFRDHLIPRQRQDELGTLYKVYGIGDDIYDYRYFTGPKKDTATKGKYYQGIPKEIFQNIESHMNSLPIENFLNYADAFGNCRLEGGVEFRSGKKPVVFLQHLLEMALKEDEDNIVLDSFAGSGSTAHAVLKLNKEKNRHNKFILVELEDDICQTKTYTRALNVINQYSSSTDAKEVGVKEGFQYCVLDKMLFDKDGKITKMCTFEDLASYIFFTETKMVIDKNNINESFIGEYNGIKYYLLFNQKNKNILDNRFLKKLHKNGNKIIYADKCTMDEINLEVYNIVFKQIPYEIRRF
jgi:adenine-specific DNA-methyltransferase